MSRIAMVVLAGLVAAFGTACVGDDDGERSGGKAALVDPAEKSAALTLSLTVVGNPKGLVGSGGSVRQLDVSYAERAGGTSGLDCVAAAAPGRTCRWEYEQTESCPPSLTDLCIEVDLHAFPPTGTRVVWTGCTLVGGPILTKDFCSVRLVAGGRHVSASFVAN